MNMQETNRNFFTCNIYEYKQCIIYTAQGGYRHITILFFVKVHCRIIIYKFVLDNSFLHRTAFQNENIYTMNHFRIKRLPLSKSMN